MRGLDRQLFRFGFVLALGLGLAVAAAHPVKPKLAVAPRPTPIVLAVAVESAPQEEVGARVDQCSLNPHDYSDSRPIGDKSGHAAKKKRIVVCG
ncbi:hypothetical protein [Rhodoblastus sp.]|jgi:hypothetical protein|uniref:hypothetical protein n=1 Tax=Rhodoblastus sp. TaxID=1962975 RepID=UPI002626F583|nr:hypothetical protein [Rhodoblastus sp.]